MNKIKLILTASVALCSLDVLAGDRDCLNTKEKYEEVARSYYGGISPERQTRFDEDYKTCLCTGWKSSKATELRNAIEDNVFHRIYSFEADRIIDVPIKWGKYLITTTGGECDVGFVADVDLCEQIDKFEAVIKLSSTQRESCEYTIRQDEIYKTTEDGAERTRKLHELQYEFYGDVQPMY